MKTPELLVALKTMVMDDEKRALFKMRMAELDQKLADDADRRAVTPELLSRTYTL